MLEGPERTIRYMWDPKGWVYRSKSSGSGELGPSIRKSFVVFHAEEETKLEQVFTGFIYTEFWGIIMVYRKLPLVLTTNCRLGRVSVSVCVWDLLRSEGVTCVICGEGGGRGPATTTTSPLAAGANFAVESNIIFGFWAAAERDTRTMHMLATTTTAAAAGYINKQCQKYNK